MVEFTRRIFLSSLGGALGYGLGRRAMASAPARKTAPASANIIQVRARPKSIHGVLKFAGHTYDCMVAKNGIVSPKFEGV